MLTVTVVSCDEPSVILCNRLRRAGLRTSGVYVQDLRSGAVDPDDFIAREQSDLVVYDLAAPLQQSLRFLAYLRALPGMDRVPFILTRDQSMAFPRGHAESGRAAHTPVRLHGRPARRAFRPAPRLRQRRLIAASQRWG